MSEGKREALVELATALGELERRKRSNRLYRYYTDAGDDEFPRRGLYARHLEFFKAGPLYRERAAIAANRVGKTEGLGGYELTLHLTGLYPGWWEGRRFDRPVSAWACGATGQTVKEIVQTKLLGHSGSHGTGLIPADCIGKKVSKSGVADAVEVVRVKHVSGRMSTLTFKSYDQKRKAFEGADMDVIWLDEECPLSIYTECVTRTMTTNGMVMLTFTPLQGLTDVILQFMPEGVIPADGGGTTGGKYLIQLTWDDAPHLDKGVKQELWDSYPDWQRDARAKGLPVLGSGVIYPYDEDSFKIPSGDEFSMPPWFKRAFAMDFGWKWTAALWGAWHPDTGVLYIYDCHKMGHAEPAIHADAILSRGWWVPGVSDPSKGGTSLRDGKVLIDEYVNYGLRVQAGERKLVESGIVAVKKLLREGRLKVFESCVDFFLEYRKYHRDEDGRIKKGQDDHLLDCLRYLVTDGVYIACRPPDTDQQEYYDARRRDVGLFKRQPAGIYGGY